MPTQPSAPWPAEVPVPGRMSRLFRRKRAEQVEQERLDRSRLRAPIARPRRIAVVGLKGGVGKTTVSVLLAGIYAQLRGEPVLLLDADPTFGSLLLRTGGSPAHSARDLAGRGDPGTLTVLAPYLTPTAQGAWVLPGGLDPVQSARFDEATFIASMDVVHRHFPVLIIDCGAGLSGGLMRQVLGGAHSLVFATSPSVDAIMATHDGLRWIVDRGFGALVANSFLALTGVPQRGAAVDPVAAARRLAGMCRGVLSIPDDPHLSAGALIEPGALADPTRRAVTHLAAEVLEAAQQAP